MIERYIIISLGRPGSQTELEPTGTPIGPCTYPGYAMIYTAGTEISPLVLPGLQGISQYGVSGLPPGLSFNPDTRTIYGTPTSSSQSRCGTSYPFAYYGVDKYGTLLFLATGILIVILP